MLDVPCVVIRALGDTVKTRLVQCDNHNCAVVSALPLVARGLHRRRPARYRRRLIGPGLAALARLAGGVDVSVAARAGPVARPHLPASGMQARGERSRGGWAEPPGSRRSAPEGRGKSGGTSCCI